MTTRQVDLLILGAGSGNSIPCPALAGEETVIVDAGAHFGGTCLNVGCIPTKMFVHPADIAHEVREATERLGASTGELTLDWGAVRDRVFGRIDPISAGGEDYRRSGEANISLIRERVRLVDDREVETERGERISARRLVIAAGSRPRTLPALPIGGRVHTSDEIMRLEVFPKRLAIVGGGVVACEFASVFAGFGSEVTLITRSGALSGFDGDVRAEFARATADRWDTLTDTEVLHAEETGTAMRLTLSTGASLEVDAVLVAAGRVPNAKAIGAVDVGFDVDARGALLVDDRQRVLRDGEPVEGVWALGDVANHWQLKHVANAEARIVQANLIAEVENWPAARRESEPGLRRDDRPVPAVVFSSPQVAIVGMTLEAARVAGHDAFEATCAYADTAWGWALEDEGSFAKLVVDRADGRLLGAHIIGPDAGILIQPLVQLATEGRTIRGVARGMFWPHPAATEIVENALLRAEEELARTATSAVSA